VVRGVDDDLNGDSARGPGSTPFREVEAKQPVGILEIAELEAGRDGFGGEATPRPILGIGRGIAGAERGELVLAPVVDDHDRPAGDNAPWISTRPGSISWTAGKKCAQVA